MATNLTRRTAQVGERVGIELRNGDRVAGNLRAWCGSEVRVNQVVTGKYVAVQTPDIARVFSFDR